MSILKKKLLEFISGYEIYQIFDKEEYQEILESGGDLSRAVSGVCENHEEFVAQILFLIDVH